LLGGIGLSASLSAKSQFLITVPALIDSHTIKRVISNCQVFNKLIKAYGDLKLAVLIGFARVMAMFLLIIAVPPRRASSNRIQILCWRVRSFQ